MFSFFRFIIVFITPISFVFAIYVFLNGSYGPGGAFQGGAILASVFLSNIYFYTKDIFNIIFYAVVCNYLSFLGMMLSFLILFFTWPADYSLSGEFMISSLTENAKYITYCKIFMVEVFIMLVVFFSFSIIGLKSFLFAKSLKKT